MSKLTPINAALEAAAIRALQDELHLWSLTDPASFYWNLLLRGLAAAGIADPAHEPSARSPMAAGIPLTIGAPMNGFYLQSGSA